MTINMVANYWHRPAAAGCPTHGFWDLDRPFRGWQADTVGTPATPYARYLDEIAEF